MRGARLMMFRCVQGKIGGSSEDNGGGGALGAPGVQWSNVLHSGVKHRSHVLKVAPSPPFRVRDSECCPLRYKHKWINKHNKLQIQKPAEI